MKKPSLPFHRRLGIYGEKQAVKLLKKKRYRILETNYQAVGKELDIIAEKEGFLCFCEVKTRCITPESLQRYGRPALAVHYEKRKHILSAARYYMTCHPTNKMPRFDIIEVYVTPNTKKFHIEKILHLEDAIHLD